MANIDLTTKTGYGAGAYLKRNAENTDYEFRSNSGIDLRDWNGLDPSGENDCQDIFNEAIEQAAVAKIATINVPLGIFSIEGAFSGASRPSLIRTPASEFDTTDRPRIRLKGAEPPFYMIGTVGFGSITPLGNHGTIIKTTKTTGGALFGVEPSVGDAVYGSGIMISLENLDFRVPHNSSLTAVDLHYAAQRELKNLFINTGIYAVDAAVPTNTSIGLVDPLINNGAFSPADIVAISGFYDAHWINEHCNVTSEIIYNCNKYAMCFQAAYHPSNFNRIGAYHNQVNIRVDGHHRFSVAQLAIEHGTGDDDWDTVDDIVDTSNLGYCDRLPFAVVLAEDITPNHDFTKNGGTNINEVDIGG